MPGGIKVGAAVSGQRQLFDRRKITIRKITIFESENGAKNLCALFMVNVFNIYF